MNKVILSSRSKLDLSHIWDYTLGQWGAEQAEKYVRGLWASIALAASDSTLSVEIDDVRKGYRKFRLAPTSSTIKRQAMALML